MDPFTIIAFLVLTAALIALSPKPKIEDARPPGNGDFRFPTTTEDRVTPIIVGTVRVDGPNVVWYGDISTVPIKEKVKLNPWSSKHVVVGYKYHFGMQLAFCRGGPCELLRLFVGDKTLWSGSVTVDSTITINEPKFFGGVDGGNGGVVGDFSFFTGTSGQLPSPYLAQFQTVGGESPRYTGLTYGVFESVYFGNSTSIDPVAAELRRIPNGLGLSVGDSKLNGGNDANPMNFAYEIITNQEWGMRFAAADVDVDTFIDMAEVLAAEGNGISMVIDRTLEHDELLREIGRQIDGHIFLDRRTGKWTGKLVRDDYAIGLVPQITPSTNLVKVQRFRAMTWKETTNEVEITYSDRITDYKERPSFQQDMANLQVQGGGSFTTGVAVRQKIAMPGVKDRTLASQIATRELRKLSYPLKSCSLEVTRALWNVKIGDVVAFSGRIGNFNFAQLPLRVLAVDIGDAKARTIRLDCVQDIFKTVDGVYAPAPPTSWEPPVDDLDPFTELMLFEAPYNVLAKNPEFVGLDTRIWCGAVREGQELGFFISARVSPDPYADYGQVFGLLLKGVLNGALNRGDGTSASFTVTMASSADRTALLAEWESGLTPTEIGTNLRHWAMIDDEFLLITTMAAGSGTDVACTGVYRGVLDSVQGDHANGADVWWLFMSGGLTDPAVADSDPVDVKLRPFSPTDEVLEAAVTAVTVTTNDRYRRPLPPGRLLLNGTIDDTTSVSLEGTGSGDSIGIGLELRRRDYRTTDETRALITDAGSIFPNFPALNSTEYQVEVRNDPAGANTLLFTIAYATGPTFTLERNDILQATGGVLPTTLGVVVRARHEYEDVSYESYFDMPWKFTIATALTGQFNFGALNQNVTSALYTATQNGTYNFTINTALATGNVEYRLNGGAFTTLISTGNTTGSIAGVVATDTIEIRHTSSTAGTQTFLAMDAPSTGQDGYAVLFKP